MVLNRKNALFAGHDEGAQNWACMASLIETCKLNDLDPQAYFTDVLTKLVNLWPASRLDDLMPWNWTTKAAVQHAASVRENQIAPARVPEGRLRYAAVKLVGLPWPLIRN